MFKKITLIVTLILTVMLFNSCKSCKRKDESNDSPTTNKITINNNTITNTIIEERLMSSYGISMLNDLIDEELLKNVTYDKSNQEEMVLASIFNGYKPQYKEDYIESKKHYYEINGLVNEDDIAKYEDLLCKRYTFAKEQFKQSLLSKENFWTDSDLNRIYTNLHREELTTKLLVIPFNSNEQMKNVFAQFNVSIFSKSMKDLETSEMLSAVDRIKKYIEVYNYIYRMKNNIDHNLIEEGIHYVIDSEKVVFNTENLLELENDESNFKIAYTVAELNEMYIPLRDIEELDVGDILAMRSNHGYYVICKLNDLNYQYDEEEIKMHGIETLFTYAYMNTVLLKNRLDHNLEISDEKLNKMYNGYIKSYQPNMEFLYNELQVCPSGEKTKNVVAKLNNMTISMDTLKEKLNERYYYSELYSLIEDYALAYASCNDLYNPYTDTIFNQTKYDYYVSNNENGGTYTVELLKQNFNMGRFTSMGFPYDYGWENFLKDYFKINNEKELVFALSKYYIQEVLQLNIINPDLYVQAVNEYNSNISSDIDCEKYFDMKVINFLIYVDLDNDGYQDEGGLTEIQKTYFDEFTNLIESEYNNLEGSVYDRYAKIVNEYNAATFDDEKWGKYICLGFKILIEREQRYTHKTSLVEEFLIECGKVYSQLRKDENYIHNNSVVGSSDPTLLS